MDMHPGAVTLSEYVDQALASDQRVDVERHLEGCEGCRGIVADLQAIRQAGIGLPPMDPPAAIWSRIEDAIRGEAPEAFARRQVGTPRTRYIGWLALAATLVVASVAGWRMLPSGPGTQAPASAQAEAGASAPDTLESELRLAEEHYTRAISGLEQITRQGNGELDPDTAAALQKNLAVVDQAIDESRAAVRTEPTNESAQTSLLDNFAMKIALLQDTVALINEMRKGNDAGAAQIVSGLK